MTNTKGIFRLSRRKRFAQIDTHCLEDENLSWKAKGMLAYLMSRTDDWATRVQHLKTVSTDGRIATASGLRELIENDYARRRQPRDDKGQLQPVEYWIVEAPPKVLKRRMPDDEYAAFIEQWKKWPSPHEDEESHKGETEEPQSENLIVDEKPQSGNLITDENKPQSENLIADESPQSENLITGEKPQSGNPSAGDPHADNLQLRKNEYTYEGLTYDRSGQSVSQSRASNTNDQGSSKPTDGPTDRPAIDSTVEEFVEWLAARSGVDWGEGLRIDISERFKPWDGPAGREWLLKKVDRLAGRFSDIGVADMVMKDLAAGECPKPRDTEIRAAHRQAARDSEEQQSSESRGESPQKERETLILEVAENEWGRALLDLRDKISAENFEAWFQCISCGGLIDEETLVLLVDDSFFQAWIEDNYRDLIEDALTQVFEREIEVELRVREHVEIQRPE